MLNRFLKSAGKALIYFVVYFGWQLLVINWAAVAISMYVSLTFDISELPGVEFADTVTPADMLAYEEDIMIAMNDKVNGIINEYAVHLTAVAGLLALVTYFFIFKARGKSLIREAGITRLGAGQCITAFALGAALNIFTTLGIGLIPFPEAWVQDYMESSAMLTDANLYMSILMTVVIAPVLEEVVFRGLCYTRLKQGMPMFAAMLIVSWGFGIMHGTVIWFLYASVFGFVLAWVYEKYQSLTAAILMHLGFNLFGIISMLMTEISDAGFWLLLAASGLASTALILQVQRTSEQKIQFTMPAETADTNKGEN